MTDTNFIGNVPLKDFILFIFLFLAASIFSNFIAEIIKRILKPKIGSNYKIPARFLQYSIIFLTVYFGFSNILHFDLTAFFTAFGIMGIIVAFSAQQTIQNVIAGVFIFSQGIIKIDDWVELPGLPMTELCQVKDIGLTRTLLRENKGGLIYIPNFMFISNKIVKYPKGDFFKASFNVKISSKTNIKKCIKIITDICNKHEKVLPNIPGKEKNHLKKFIKITPKENLLTQFFEEKIDTKRFEPTVIVKEITKDSINLEVDIWIWEINNKEKIISDILNQFLIEFPRNGINLS